MIKVAQRRVPAAIMFGQSDSWRVMVGSTNEERALRAITEALLVGTKGLGRESVVSEISVEGGLDWGNYTYRLLWTCSVCSSNRAVSIGYPGIRTWEWRRNH